MISVLDLIKGDQSRVVEIESEAGLALIRFRVPVLGGFAVAGYDHMLVVLWAYGDPDQGLLPTPETASEMLAFEDHICNLLELDAHAVLVAVLTLDGARQWVFYTGDVHECISRLKSLPRPEEANQIEIGSREDPEWQYLRQEILGNIDYDS
jgi:hypothetical protein